MEFGFVADGLFFLSLAFWFTAIKVVAGLTLVIFVHELGHFAVAKLVGVKCEKFYIGFDVPIRIGPIRLPAKLLHWQWGETEYGVGIIPLGGYVKMLGQDDNPTRAAEEADRIKIRKERDGAEGDDAEYELDPRSFPAKSVPARMAIISAGVIMNLIFAVIFGAIAYRFGVPFMTTEVGRVAEGSPAWQAGLQPGDKIIQIGKKGEPSEYLQFDWDLMQGVGKTGLGSSVQPLDLKIRRRKDGTSREFWVQLIPSDRLIRLELADFVTIGVSAPRTTTILPDPDDPKRPMLLPYLPAGKLEGQIEPGDRIVQIDGRPLDRHLANQLGDLPGWELDIALAERFDRPVTLTFERPADDSPEVRTFDATIEPTPWRTLGIVCQLSPVVAVQQGSPAEQAGIRVGDRIVALDGEPLGDPLTLPQRMARYGKPKVTVTIERAEEGEAAATRQVVVPVRPVVRYGTNTPATLISVDALGVAFAVESKVVSVVPDSAAAEQGIEPGDELIEASFEFRDEATERLVGKLMYGEFVQHKKIRLGKLPNWVYLMRMLQEMPPMTKVVLSVRKGPKDERERQVTLLPHIEPDQYALVRGLVFGTFQRVREVDSWSTAFSLGYQFTTRKLLEVVEMLGKLVTGRWSPKHLGGPVAIAAIAGREASQGITRLLLFLTFLSANLAILNFLPIPALDGGHMVFLAAEGITGKPVNENVQGFLTLIGVILLLTLIVLVTSKDIWNLITTFLLE